MKRLAFILWIALFLGFGMPALADQILRIGIAIDGPNVAMRALNHPTMETHVQPIRSIARLQSVFFSLECFVDIDCSNLMGRHKRDAKILGLKELVSTLKDEGERLLGPFARLIDSADEVRLEIDWSLLKIPFDLLYLRDKPMFVAKKVSYAVGPLGKAFQPSSRDWVGLLVSDASADPERAIFGIEESFPRSTSFDISEFQLSMLQGMQPIDFVAISGHGFVRENGDGFIALGKGEKLRPGSLTKLSPTLVYLDSCNLGISSEHLKKLREGGTVYAVAPILSNEAGGSSTATIDAFFSELAKGTDPITALFTARSKLYQRYANNDLRTMLWRSFPFRVYRLN
jgi:hypothetical protein